MVNVSELLRFGLPYGRVSGDPIPALDPLQLCVARERAHLPTAIPGALVLSLDLRCPPIILVVINLYQWLRVKRFICFLIFLICLGSQILLALVVGQEFPMEL